MTAPIWEAAKNCKCGLPADFKENPAACLEARGVVLKKSGFHRLVYRLDNFLVKEFQFSSLFERLKWKHGFSAPQKEWRALGVLKEEGVSVPAPVALGHAMAGSAVRVWLVAEFLEDCLTYDEIRPCFSDAKVMDLARTIAGMHAASYVHNDLHAGNLLWQEKTGRWYVTDFQHARRGLCTRPMLEGDLVQLQHCLGKKAPRRQRIIFLREYIRSFAEWTETLDTHSGRDWHLVWQEISRRMAGYDVSQARSRSKRAFKGNRHYAAYKSDGLQVFVMRGESALLSRDALELLKDPQWTFRRDISRPERQHATTTAIYKHPQGDISLSVTEEAPSFLEKHLPFLNPARKLWRSAARLSLLHIACERPLFLAMGESGYAYGALSAIKYSLSEYASLPFRSSRRVSGIRSLGRFAGRLHRLGVGLGRMDGEGIGLSETGGLIVRRLDRLTFHQSLPWFARVRDLSDLLHAFQKSSSYFERRLFLRHYLMAQGEKIDTRLLISDVVYRARILAEDEQAD